MLAITSSSRKQPLSLRSSVRNAMPGVHRDAGVVHRDLPAVDRDRARGRRRDAEQGLGDIAAPRADEAGEAENLALAQIEARCRESVPRASGS